MAMQFHKAQRKKARLRLGLTGPSGSGKTWGALQIAKGIGGRVAVIDTERGSASLYSHLAEFDVLELTAPYSPERFIEALDAAQQAGYDVVIVDSVTHEWVGVGGCLELVDDIARAKYKGNSWSAWSDITPRHRALLDAITQSPLHVIVTMRSKTETSQVEDGGRKKVVKLGMKAEQRDGFEYELTTVLDIVHDGHYATASKDRTGLFTDVDPQPITVATGKRLLAWLESGAEPLPQTEAPRQVGAPPAGDEPSPPAAEPDPPNPRMAHLEAIHAAKTLNELKTVYAKAYTWAKRAGDNTQLALFTEAKDMRKAELQKADTQEQAA